MRDVVPLLLGLSCGTGVLIASPALAHDFSDGDIAVSIVTGTELGGPESPLLGMAARLAINDFLAFRVSGDVTPLNTASGRFKVAGGLLLPTPLYVGAEMVYAQPLHGTGSPYAEAVAGVRIPLGFLKFGGEYRYGLGGPDSVMLSFGSDL